MRIYAPDYYGKFKCVAARCRHNCCIGWEIDIDKSTYKKYSAVGGDFGSRLRDGIIIEDGAAHFVLADGERCPFLNSNNLCDIIINLGEDSLCEICAAHPRYRNFFDSREEVGLGLCCETAAELILTRAEKTKLVAVGGKAEDEAESAEEDMFFKLRESIIKILQNRELSIDDRIEGLFENFGVDLPDKSLGEWAEVFLGLERLDEEWTNKLNKLHGREFVGCKMKDGRIAAALEQLLVYFVFRHLSDGIYDGKLYERAAFAVLSMRIICAVGVYAVSADEKLDVPSLIEAARMYSLEIEYSDENIEGLLECLS